ncbi:AMP-binding protein [Actinomyces sp. B33]|uniref:AMP-binding protein n=1 Tax=Actinomyces sp. B33 TaxID=2942131 RepID=UPI002340C2E3|nr:AMP-binding protein [Actinomyces sp. B33]MDC4233532.1 AMP-binding protein [Actinomyces sp. B33]
MSTPRILVVPGGTSIGAVALANASIHKLVELWEERRADPDHLAPHTVVVLRDPDLVPPATLRSSATTPAEAFPADLYPGMQERLDDPGLFDGVDLVIATSGSSAGTPRLVGLSIDALIASARATEKALDGPGTWILALPCDHIAGAMVLLRAALAETSPQIVDCSEGFDPTALLPAVAGATEDPSVPAYLSLVPTQLAACLDAGDDVRAALASLAAVLVGGSAIDPDLVDAARGHGIRVVTTYGMTETCGGCVYDGLALPGVSVRAVDSESGTRLAVAGPTLMTRYLDADSPFFDEGGTRWLMTGDIGAIRASGHVEVRGRADDVIISGGLSVSPEPVADALLDVDGVREAWVVGVPDDKWGEIVTGVVVPDEMPDGGEAMASFGERIRDEVGEVLGRPQSPQRIVAVDALPRTASGKIDRGAVASLVESAPAERVWSR